MVLIRDVFMENPFANSAVIDLAIQWRDCEIYVIKISKMSYNVIKKANFILFVNKAVGLEMHFIGFQTTYYHADTS